MGAQEAVALGGDAHVGVGLLLAFGDVAALGEHLDDGAVLVGEPRPGHLAAVHEREALLHDPEAPRLDALGEMGFAVAIDDFGTGFSSIGTLRRMPFDTLKIDRSFLRADTDGRNQALVEAIARLGHVIGKVVVCEGVETEAQARALRGAGCDLLQGYHFGRPVPFDVLLGLPGVLEPPEGAPAREFPGEGLRSRGLRTCS